MNLYTVCYFSKESKTFMIGVSPTVLRDNGSPEFDFSSLDYQDISSHIEKSMKKPKKPSALAYRFDNLE